MEIIHITGLDGSGKSTLMSRLEEKGSSEIGFLRYPLINAEKFNKDARLYKEVLFINWLHNEADNMKVPQLKAAALFASMLIFSDLMKEFEKNGKTHVFCERHPLIDTAVFAQFYAEQLHPASIPGPTRAEIDYNFNAELSYFAKTLNLKKADMPQGAMHALLQLMYDWFYLHKKFALEHLRELFLVEMPSKIYYLKASPQIIMQRINRRVALEPHETLADLEKFIPAYDEVLAKSKVNTIVVDSNGGGHVDKLFDEISKEYFSKPN